MHIIIKYLIVGYNIMSNRTKCILQGSIKFISYIIIHSYTPLSLHCLLFVYKIYIIYLNIYMFLCLAYAIVPKAVIMYYISVSS